MFEPPSNGRGRCLELRADLRHRLAIADADRQHLGTRRRSNLATSVPHNPPSPPSTSDRPRRDTEPPGDLVVVELLDDVQPTQLIVGDLVDCRCRAHRDAAALHRGPDPARRHAQPVGDRRRRQTLIDIEPSQLVATEPRYRRPTTHRPTGVDDRLSQPSRRHTKPFSDGPHRLARLIGSNRVPHHLAHPRPESPPSAPTPAAAAAPTT